MSRHSEETRAAAVAAYAAGESAERVGARIGAGAPTVLRWVRASGVPVRHGGHPPCSPAQVAQWAEQYTAGASIAQIAASAGVSCAVVQRRLILAGVTMRAAVRVAGRNASPLDPRPATEKPQRQASITAAQVDVWAAQYAAGSTVAQIAAAHGVAAGTVRSRLRARGIDTSGGRRGRRPTYTAERQAAWVAAYEAGTSIMSLAARADETCSYETIRRALIRAGVTMRPPGGRATP